MSKISVIILAAGLGKRTLQPKPKVSLETAEKKALLSYVLDAVAPLDVLKTVVVVGHGREHVEAIVRSSVTSEQINNISFALQAEQKGTGHATLCGIEDLGSFDGPVLILYGDMPLISSKSLESLITLHEDKKSTATILTTFGDETSSYGRILRDEKGNITGIREARDCNAQEKGIRELNVGVYVVEKVFLEPVLKNLKPDNAQKELYLTDVIIKAAEEGQRVESLATTYEESLGVNDLLDLQNINAELRQRIVTGWIRKGVKIPFPSSVYIDPTVVIGTGSYLGSNTELYGTTTIGNNVSIDGTAIIKNSTVSDGTHIKIGCTIENTQIGQEVTVGPFINLRPDTVIKEKVRIGNFVEIKKSVLDAGSKVPHLSYIGDAQIGSDANIGGGTITCNYDGFKKSKTIVEKNAFVGSNSSLVAPVTVGEGSIVGAGSVITKDVAPDSLALVRAPQISKEGWAKKKRADYKK